jgi:arylsulfatase A-like enzyme
MIDCRRLLVGWLALVPLTAVWMVESDAAERRPNVLVILTDDQGVGDLSIQGNTNLSTPNVDSLGRDGALFERFYVCPVCSPTRAEFLTGRYHPRGNVSATSTGGERLDLDERTIADVFKAAGYATAAFGKWHNGTQYPYHPNGRGFDEFYGFCSGHWGDYFGPPLEHNGEIVQGEGFVADDFTNKATGFIQQHSDGPFFAYVAYNTPHSPMQVPDRWWNEFKDKPIKLRGTNPKREDVDHTRAALAMCENIDWNVGRLLRRLDELNIANNTIVVYFCDNGPNGARWTGGLRGAKGSTDEGGVRSPFLIRWPRHIAAGKRITQIAAAIDLLPTLADLAGIPMGNTKPLDGKSLKPLLVNPPSSTPANNADSELRDRLIFSHWNGNVSVRNQKYCLDNAGRLYDLTADPGQKIDVGTQQPKVHDQLAAAVKDWKESVLSELNRDDNRPLIVGGAESIPTQLPAADAESHGGIERSNQHPNSSFFTNWTSTDDSITWNVDVARGGQYEAEIYYTCSAADAGSTIELSCNAGRVEGEVSQPNDPPIRGAEHDRVPRGESYVKDFRPMKLGTVELTKGRGELKLRALKIPGGQAMDFRLLVLKKRSD